MAGQAHRRHHLVIAGTGRAGTTFLVRYLTAIGLDTHLSRRGPNAWFDEQAQAGLEDVPLGTDADELPYVVKNPLVYEFIDQLLASEEIEIDAVIIPMRSLQEAAGSRAILERRAMYEKWPWLASLDRAWGSTGSDAPGGLVYSLNALDAARLLAVGFHTLVERLVQADVPIIFLDFPRLIHDPAYLFRKLAAFHNGLDEAAATAVHSRLADPRKVRTERDLGAPANGVTANDLSDENLDRAALRRELVRLREEARVGAERLRNSAVAGPVAASAATRVCYLHAGTHKTGTTAIQDALTRAPDVLEARGIYVPRSGRLGRFGGHHEIAARAMDDPTFDPASGEFAAIFREIVDCAAPSVVISSENFQYLHARPDALERMRDSLEAIGYEMRVILYLRPQVEYAESLHAELLKHGLDRSLDALVEEILETGSIAIPQGRVFRFEYGSLLNAFAGVVGPERLLVRRFDRNLPPHALINDFFSLFQWSADDVAALGSAPEPNVRTRETGHRRIRTTELMRFIRRFSADRRLVARQYGVDIPIVQAERVLSGPFGRPPLQA